jgi:hypothetical protein
MEKKVVEFSAPKDVLVKVKGLEIMVKPYLDLGEQTGLIESYVETYFNSEKRNVPADKYDVFAAENTLRLAIIDFCSDIKIEGAFENLYYDTEIYKAIRKEILNYHDFRSALDETVRNIKEQKAMEASVGTMIDIVAKKVTIALDQLSQTIANLKPEDVEKMKVAANDLIKQINETPLVQQVFEDSQRGK